MVPAKESWAADVSVEDEVGTDNEPEVAASALPRLDRVFIGRVMRFMVGIQSPAYAPRARLHGYDKAAHQEGWKHLTVAMGADRPFDHWFLETALTSKGEGGNSELLVALDELENLWFPRVRAIIRHKVAREHRDAFAASFFKDLEQQPLGPTVVGSMSVFIGRVEALAKSKQPGAKEVAEAIEARGLTKARVSHIKGLIALAQGAPKPAAPKPSAEEIAKAQQRQRDAVADLRDWFNDWATTLRPLFGPRDQLSLGLTQPSRGKPEDDEEAPDVPPPAAPPV